MRNSENYMITTGSEPLTTDDETTRPSLRAIVGFVSWLLALGIPFLIYGGNTLFSSSIPAFLLALMPVAVVVGVALHSLSTASSCIVRHHYHHRCGHLWSVVFMADGLTYGIIKTREVAAVQRKVMG